MKSIITIMSVCTLLVAAANCYGAEQGQKITVSVVNTLTSEGDAPTPAPLYGNIYQANVAGKVNEKGEKTYYTIEAGRCIEFKINKPTTLKQQRVIFATTKKALRDKIKNNKNSNQVDSLAIKQSAVKGQNLICYWVTPSVGKKEIKTILSGSTCSPCETKQEASIAQTIESITD